ncbi:MAG: hypothetical protein ACRELT_18590 [Longimicrobiales bacterium]
MNRPPDLPQSVSTLAAAVPGQRVTVRGLLGLSRCCPLPFDIDPGDRLYCTRASRRELEFETASGRRFNVARPVAENVRIDRASLTDSDAAHRVG